jgi:hypothetical protein
MILANFLGDDMILTLALSLLIVYVFLLLVLRACFFVFVIKSDPIGSLIPKLNWWQKKQKQERLEKIVMENS